MQYYVQMRTISPHFNSGMPPRKTQFASQGIYKSTEFAQFDFERHQTILKAYLRSKMPYDTVPQHFEISLDDLARENPELVVCIYKDAHIYLKLAQAALFEQDGQPEELKRQTYLSFQPLSTQELVPFRELLKQIGHFVQFNATVTFASQILPECTVATYYCESCKNQFHIIVKQSYFTPPAHCPQPQCKTAPVQLYFYSVLSRFNDLHVYNVQERPEEVPAGGIPRQIQVYHRVMAGSATEPLRPGDRVRLAGYVLPMAEEGHFFGLEPVFFLQQYERVSLAENLLKLYLASSLDDLRNLPPDTLYSILLRSFAPQLFGVANAKLSCLCALVGGSAARCSDIKIRRNINLLLIGDPGVSKSQLLKATASASSRSCYVAGRGTTTAGLTAAAVRPTKNAPFAIEPGALILADYGVCCIDEFDKIREEDRTAIYEVLEQQTLSISKAGIAATLNARTTVVAAANPKFSKWDPDLSLKENLDLPEALISRFDIVFVMRDAIDQENDYQLALHVAEIHKGKEAAKSDGDILPEGLLKAYLDEVREIEARIQPELLQKYVDGYCQDRAEKAFATPRALLSTVRISQALAKLRGSRIVQEKDVDAARALLSAADESAEMMVSKTKARRNYNQLIKTLIGQRGINDATLMKKATEKGMSEEQVKNVLERFYALEIAQLANGIWTLK